MSLLVTPDQGKNQIFGERVDSRPEPVTNRPRATSIATSTATDDRKRPATCFGREARSRTTYRPWRRISYDYGSWLLAAFPWPKSIHVVAPSARAPSASLRDDASATLALVTTTSTAARTRERDRYRVSREGHRAILIRAPHVPVRTLTHGETPALAGRISLTVHVNTSLPTPCYRPHLCTAGQNPVRRATRVPQEGVSNGQLGSHLTTVDRRSRPGPGQCYRLPKL